MLIRSFSRQFATVSFQLPILVPRATFTQKEYMQLKESSEIAPSFIRYANVICVGLDRRKLNGENGTDEALSAIEKIKAQKISIQKVYLGISEKDLKEVLDVYEDEELFLRRKPFRKSDMTFVAKYSIFRREYLPLVQLCQLSQIPFITIDRPRDMFFGRVTSHLFKEMHQFSIVSFLFFFRFGWRHFFTSQCMSRFELKARSFCRLWVTDRADYVSLNFVKTLWRDLSWVYMDGRKNRNATVVLVLPNEILEHVSNRLNEMKYFAPNFETWMDMELENLEEIFTNYMLSIVFLAIIAPLVFAATLFRAVYRTFVEKKFYFFRGFVSHNYYPDEDKERE